MKAGIYVWGGPTKNAFSERMQILKDVGFTSICLGFVPLDRTDIAVTNADQVRIAEQYGFPVDAVHLSGDKMTTIWSECDDAELVTKRLIDELTALKHLGLKTGVAHVTWGHDVPEAPSVKALDRFKRIADAADRLQVQVAFENSVFPEHVHYVLDHLDNDYVGFCYDSGHENAFTPGENYLDRHGHRLFAMHIHDNHGTDEHNLPFNGTIDWKHVMSQLRKTELFQKGGIILESGGGPGDFRSNMEQSIESIRRLMEL